jgi:hypothetical protein
MYIYCTNCNFPKEHILFSCVWQHCQPSCKFALIRLMTLTGTWGKSGRITSESGNSDEILRKVQKSAAFLMLWVAQRMICYWILMKRKPTLQIQNGTHMTTLSTVKVRTYLTSSLPLTMNVMILRDSKYVRK